MNTKILTLMTVLFLGAAGNAFGYQEGQANPPDSPETEYRTVKKSETTNFDDAIAKGDILGLDVDNTNDGYTVTRVGTNSIASASKIVCIASEEIATGNTGLVRCVSKGYISYLKYDASGAAIVKGSKLCANSIGAAVVCTGCTVSAGLPGVYSCANGSASANSPIVSLEIKASGQSGTDLKALIQSR